MKINFKKGICTVLSAVMFLSAAACGEKAAEANITGDNKTDVSVSEGTQTEAKPVSGNASKDLENAVGKWIAVADRYDGNTGFPEDDYFDGELDIYKEDNKYAADWLFDSEGFGKEIYGRKLEVKEGVLYGNCENQKWYADFYSKSRDDSNNEIRFTMIDMDTIELLNVNSVTYKDDLGNDVTDTFSTVYYLRREGADNTQYINDLRYPETYTVSNVKDFYNALGSNRKIILEGGTYNFSELSDSDKRNSNIDYYWDEYSYEQSYNSEDRAFLDSIRNLIIEGKEGEEVHICTNDPLVAPLNFQYANHISLRNLKVGHNAEKGMCAGAVINIRYSSNINIDDCRFYGCGTYGIDAVGANYMYVNNTDIYECSYGIFSLYNCFDCSFSNCIMRDSEDLSMFRMNDCNNILVTGCEIKNNKSLFEYSPFIDAENSYGDIVFENCIFDNNEYVEYTLGDVIFR